MKTKNQVHCFLLVCILSLMVSCQKEMQEQNSPGEKTFQVSEKVIVNEEIENSSSSLAERTIIRDYGTYYGPTVEMGNGQIRSWINITRGDNKPLAIGIEFTAKSLQELPSNPLNFAANSFLLKLHQKAKAVTPFDHLVVNWEPHGHDPAGIYNVPHFDIHFYKITLAAQMAIPGVPGPVPPPGYLPVSYVIQGATVPQMGTHWLDPSSPELPPTSAPFTHTFIYGSDNGHVHFLEPMITRKFLLGGSTVAKKIPQPTHFSPSGTHYPTVYKIWKDATNGRHYVALKNFVWR